MKKQEPKNIPNDDYIKKSDCIKAITKAEKWWWNADDLQEYREIFESIPAANVEPVKHGYNMKWDYKSLFECSLCSWSCYDTYMGDTDVYNYCPNCGAKMDTEPPKEL